MTYRITSAAAIRYPVLRITFDDGLTGEYDLTSLIDDGPIFAPLRDKNFFQSVAVAPDGHAFGWNLDRPGDEIDFCPDATRIRIETQNVEELAARFRERRPAA